MGMNREGAVRHPFHGTQEQRKVLKNSDIKSIQKQQSGSSRFLFDARFLS